MSIDFFVVPTVKFKVLFVLVILAHHRRRIVHFNITEHPTAQWTAQQIIEAFPWDTAPKYLLRDRDAIYGSQFRKRVRSLGVEEVITAPRSPWQSPFVERVIGSIRRDCLNHVIVLHERHLKRSLKKLFLLLSSLAHTFVVGDGQPGIASSAVAGTWKRNRLP